MSAEGGEPGGLIIGITLAGGMLIMPTYDLTLETLQGFLRA